MMMKRLFIGMAVIWLSVSAVAELKLPALFSDGMVLQRDQPVAVWGWADPGADVTVSFADQQKTGVADFSRHWKIILDPMSASSNPRKMTVSSTLNSELETLNVSDVLIGEVWLCSGQSNMQMPVKSAGNFEKEQAGARHPMMRMFQVDLRASTELQEDCSGTWTVCRPGTVGEFSATAYFFGREILRVLKVPVGLISSSWGATFIEPWSPMASLEQFPSVMESKAQQDREAVNFDEPAAEKRFANAMADWTNRVAQARAAGNKPPRPPRLKVHPQKSRNYPANLYNAMIHPLVPYSLRGAIWYQGEANAETVDQAILYRDLLENMVTEWRRDWGSEFPFYAVQLPNYRAPGQEPVQDSGWAFIRESFLKFSSEVPNAGIAVTIDVGKEKIIHPPCKQAVGYRLAQQALARTYKQNNVAGGPIYKSMKKAGDQIVLTFADIGSGLMAQGGEPLKTFAIAGADQRFVFAQAEIVGDTVVVRSPEVPDPVAVRYAWADNPAGCNLFNREGFPASPFRTDDWAAMPE
jgi:sialate O-acetylesterase